MSTIYNNSPLFSEFRTYKIKSLLSTWNKIHIWRTKKHLHISSNFTHINALFGQIYLFMIKFVVVFLNGHSNHIFIFVKCILKCYKTKKTSLFLSFNLNIQLRNDPSVCRNEIQKSRLFVALFIFQQSPVYLQQ